MAHPGFVQDQKETIISPETKSPCGSPSHISIVPVGRENLSKALPPHESYEGRHRWDPNAVWSEKEEARLVWKTDLYFLSWVCVMFFGLQLDRGNLSNALTDDLLTDLKLTTNDYNNVCHLIFNAHLTANELKGTTIQLLCFLVAEFPVQMLTKRFGFRMVLPFMMMAWGTVCVLLAVPSALSSLSLHLSSLVSGLDQ